MINDNITSFENLYKWKLSTPYTKKCKLLRCYGGQFLHYYFNYRIELINNQSLKKTVTKFYGDKHKIKVRKNKKMKL